MPPICLTTQPSALQHGMKLLSHRQSQLKATGPQLSVPHQSFCPIAEATKFWPSRCPTFKTTGAPPPPKLLAPALPLLEDTAPTPLVPTACSHPLPHKPCVMPCVVRPLTPFAVLHGADPGTAHHAACPVAPWHPAHRSRCCGVSSVLCSAACRVARAVPCILHCRAARCVAIAHPSPLTACRSSRTLL